MPRWCRECRAKKEDERLRKRQAVRRCYKCNTPVPEAARKPGVAVCADCRADSRDPEKARAKERRRTLRKYGLTEDDYEQMLRDQGGRCLGCGTDQPGAKGWCIDHCHASGMVRALLCNRCNTALGLANEDPKILRALASLAERWQRAESEIKI